MAFYSIFLRIRFGDFYGFYKLLLELLAINERLWLVKSVKINFNFENISEALFFEVHGRIAQAKKLIIFIILKYFLVIKNGFTVSFSFSLFYEKENKNQNICC